MTARITWISASIIFSAISGVALRSQRSKAFDFPYSSTLAINRREAQNATGNA